MKRVIQVYLGDALRLVGTIRYDYTEIVDALRIYGADLSAILKSFGRIAFYILINNVDEHLLTLGFLHVAGGTWKP